MSGHLQGRLAQENTVAPNIVERRHEMAVKKVGEKYRCNICGNEVTVDKVGGGTLVCCGENMELIGS